MSTTIKRTYNKKSKVVKNCLDKESSKLLISTFKKHIRRAAKEAALEAKEAVKAEKKAAKEAVKAEKKAAKEAEKAEKKAAKDAEKAEKKAAKNAEKAVPVDSENMKKKSKKMSLEEVHNLVAHCVPQPIISDKGKIVVEREEQEDGSYLITKTETVKKFLTKYEKNLKKNQIQEEKEAAKAAKLAEKEAAKEAAKAEKKAAKDAEKAEKKAANLAAKKDANERYKVLDYEGKVEMVSKKYSQLLEIAADKNAAIDEIINTTNKSGWVRMLMGNYE
jgi:membrane protein involved in colicin uptake